MHRLLIVCCLWVGISVAASAAANAQIYIGLHGGANFLQDSDLDGDDGTDAAASFDPGFAIGGVIGYRFGVTDHLAIDVEGEFAYRLNSVDEVSASGFSDNGDGEAQSFSWMANAWLNWQIGDSGFAPYLGGGFGGVHIDLNDAEVAGLELSNESDFVIGGQLGGGLNYQVVEHLVLSLDYRFLITQEPHFEAFSAEYQSHSVMLGLKYLF